MVWSQIMEVTRCYVKDQELDYIRPWGAMLSSEVDKKKAVLYSAHFHFFLQKALIFKVP